MFDGLSFEQFGSYAIVFTIFSIIIGVLARELIRERKKSDELQEKRVEDAKEYREDIKVPMQNMTSLTQQIYDHIIRNSRSK